MVEVGTGQLWRSDLNRSAIAQLLTRSVAPRQNARKYYQGPSTRSSRSWRSSGMSKRSREVERRTSAFCRRFSDTKDYQEAYYPEWRRQPQQDRFWPGYLSWKCPEHCKMWTWTSFLPLTAGTHTDGQDQEEQIGARSVISEWAASKMSSPPFLKWRWVRLWLRFVPSAVKHNNHISR